MDNKIGKSYIMLKLAAILLCLVLITTHFTSGLYAKYTNQAYADDLARVAYFVIETDLDRASIQLGMDETPTLQLGGLEETQSVQLPFYISSGSEVAVGYSVGIDFGEVLPEYLSITLTNGANSQTITADGQTSEFVFSDFGTLAAGGSEQQTVDLLITISVSDFDKITEDVSINAAKLTVYVYQVD